LLKIYSHAHDPITELDHLEEGEMDNDRLLNERTPKIRLFSPLHKFPFTVVDSQVANARLITSAGSDGGA
jgi:hypothetical protein